MKKSTLNFVFTIVFVLCTALFGFAQNLVINGDLESWTAGEPDGWGVIENISQETTTIHGGASSANHTSDEGTKDFQQEITDIQPGTDYTISYWYHDNDPQARTRIWSKWIDIDGQTLDDHAEILRPSVYSEDNANWQEFNVVLTAPAAAVLFRYEVRVYKQDGNWGGSVYYDDFVFSGDMTVYPEPSNYPTGFSANAVGSGIDLTWTDATGPDLPSAYIIMAGTDASLPVPVDGMPVADDLDLSDGNGALNVPFGNEAAAFSNLEGNTTYYFTIYSYANAGANIDYKTDGTAPAANETTSSITVIESENFDDSWGNWTPISVTGTQEWSRDNTYGIGDSPCASMTGYEGQPYENDDWLISPALDLDSYDNEVLVFYNAVGFDGPALQLKISTDYDGGGDPYSATWMEETFTLATGYFEWTESGAIDLSGYAGSEVYVAFHFTSSDIESATWEVDDISITGEEQGAVEPEPTNYPTNFSADENGTTILITWTDAIGAQLPDKYIIFAGTSSTLPTPTDGTPVPNDTDLSDGSGALNVNFGIEEAMFSDLVVGTTYYFSIYPYTNSGSNIDYKNDGTAPTDNATIQLIPEPTNYPTDFSAEATGTTIDLSWIDAIGTQLPEKYIIFAADNNTLPVPEDGTPTDDDPDLSDGSAALNIDFGVEEASFSNLVPETTYYFTIYPYTNSGMSIDYKNDGTAPTANATVEEPTAIIIESENFDESWGNWERVSVTGTQEWDRDNSYGFEDSPCAKMSGYEGQAYENDDWLISPALNLDNYDNEILVFLNAMSYTGPDLELKVSTDYISGSNDPYSATWTTESFTQSPGFFEWIGSGEIDLSGYDGSAVHIAFHFTCNDQESATWEIDNITISGDEDVSTDDQVYYDDLFRIYPNPSTGIVNIEMPDRRFKEVHILSLTGSIVKSYSLDNEFGSIKISDLSKGLYFIMFNDQETGQTITKKLILK